MVKVFLARQPILNRKGKIEAYELLFRSGLRDMAAVEDSGVATAKVLESLVGSFGLVRIIRDKKGFINIDEKTDLLDMVEFFPPDKIGFEVLETSLFNREFLEKLCRLKEMGYELALDDFEFEERFVPYLELVDMVKIDVLGKGKGEIEELYSKVRKYNVRVLAEKVEDYDTYKFCLDLGFDLFQGFFFQKPQTVVEKTVEPNYTALIQLYNLVSSKADIRDIEKVFKRFSDLSVKLLQLINSAYFSLRQPVKSIKHSILMLGYKNILRWILLLMYSLKEENLSSDPLFEDASIRGFFMEEIAKRITVDRDVEEGAFITGVLSLIDVLLGVPMEKVVSEIALSEEVREALLRRRGILGDILTIVEKVQQGRVEDLGPLLDRYKLSTSEVLLAQMEALKRFNDLEV